MHQAQNALDMERAKTRLFHSTFVSPVRGLSSVPYQVHFALDVPSTRPWTRYRYCTWFHDLDLYEIGHC